MQVTWINWKIYKTCKVTLQEPNLGSMQQIDLNNSDTHLLCGVAEFRGRFSTWELKCKILKGTGYTGQSWKLQTIDFLSLKFLSRNVDFEKRSNSSIISIFVKIFMWFSVLVINVIRPHYKSGLNEEEDAGCIQISKQPRTNLVHNMYHPWCCSKTSHW